MKVTYHIPVTVEQGPCDITGRSSAFETAYQNALWEYNSMRFHDGQPPIRTLPLGTTFTVEND